jgi:hypothetical protein
MCVILRPDDFPFHPSILKTLPKSAKAPAFKYWAFFVTSGPKKASQVARRLVSYQLGRFNAADSLATRSQ